MGVPLIGVGVRQQYGRFDTHSFMLVFITPMFSDMLSCILHLCFYSLCITCVPSRER